MVVLGVMIIGIVSTARYTATGYDLTRTVELKEGANETQNPAGVVAMNDSIKHDISNQNAKSFATSQNPADITMCDDELHGCQSFNVLVSTNYDLAPFRVYYSTTLLMMACQ
ncbi:hypothetical protein PG997_001286 [Apiospora hydei]|uniref:Uncharacterized protein n=1 Tax=Apiospora hydei TaxID=1337664 RepID=A0ABR1XD61_9PEZI